MVQSKKLLIIFGILAVSLLPRFLLTEVRTVMSELPVKFLADRVGEWEAVEVLICPQCHKELQEAFLQRTPPKNPKARMVYMEDELEDERCPIHGLPLVKTTDVPISFLVKTVLPQGTLILRKWYRKPTNGRAPIRRVLVTVVTSGADKRGIHRPERCLPAQGWGIVSRSKLAVPLSPAAKRTLNVIVRPVQRKEKRKEVVLYWFMSPDRLTGSNMKRLLWGWWDRVFHGRNYRWSYALLISPVERSVAETSEQMARFTAKLLPLIYGGG